MKIDFFKETVARRYDPRNMPGFETFEEARDHQKLLVEILRVCGTKGRALADVLENCRKDNRCRSAACPICLRRFRRFWCSRVAEYLDDDLTRWSAASIVPVDLAFPVGELDRFNFVYAKDRLRKQLERSEIRQAIVIGGFDYALQTFKDRAPKWRAHLYFPISASKSRVRHALKRYYLPDADTKKPVIVKLLKDDAFTPLKVATYSFKANFYKREPASDPLGNADTSHSELDPNHQAELALFLHKQGFLGRTIRRGHSLDFHKLRTR
jgi:hypothetical protein